MNGYRTAARFFFVLLALGVAACGGDSSGPRKAGRPAMLRVVSGSGQEGQAGEALSSPLVVNVTDGDGLTVSKAIVNFTIASGGGTLSQRTDTTDTEGLASTTWTMGSELGESRVEARVQGVTAPAVFTAQVKAGSPTTLGRESSVIGNSAAGFEVIDSVAIKITDRFSHPVAGTTVTFAVTAGGGTISHTTKKTADDGIARTAWKFGGAGPQTLRATAGALIAEINGTAVSCEERTMAVGDVLDLYSTGRTCVIMNGSGARKYLVTVANGRNQAASFTSLRLRGAGGGTATATTAVATLLAFNRLSAAAAQQRPQLEAAQERAQAHQQLLRADAALVQRLGSPRRAAARISGNVAPATQPAPLPKVGDVLPVKILKNFSNICSPSNVANNGTRVVYVGSRSIILEDTTITRELRGQFDERYRAIGQEFDEVMYPILAANYGNPLAMDGQTDQNSRIFMVFSPVVNALPGGTIGFVTAGDFFPAAGPVNRSCPASNFGEYFYARTPTSTATGFDTGPNTLTVDEWYRTTRAVIIHEVKHVTSFAEKFASPIELPLDFFGRDEWLEESSAMLAEELWLRRIFNYAQRENVTYRRSVYCEVRPDVIQWPDCAPAKPFGVAHHFTFLYQYASDPERRSAIGPATSGDFTYYGSGWMLLRWLVDHFATSEPAFLRALNLEMLSPGTENVEKRTGQAFPELLADFVLAMALDDHPGFTPRDAKYSFPSWNVPDIFLGLSADFSRNNPPAFADPTPLKVRRTAFGGFVVDIPTVAGGGFAAFEVAGTATNQQLLEFRGPAGTGFPAELRVKVVRLQ